VKKRAWSHVLAAICAMILIACGAPALAQTLMMAQIAPDAPPAGWPDPDKIVHQIEVMGERSLEKAMNDPDRTRKRVKAQVDAVRDRYGARAPIYLDIEPGRAGWGRRDVQDFAIELLRQYQNVWLFPGVSFDALVADDEAAAVRIAAAASNGLMFPAYHGNATMAQHEKLLRRRFDRLVASGIKFVPVTWRLYHDAVGQTAMRTDVPRADFLRGLAICREYSPVVVIWSWRKEGGWDPLGEEELLAAATVGDQALVAQSVSAVRAERDRLAAQVETLTSERAAAVAALDQISADLVKLTENLAEWKGRFEGLAAKYEEVRTLVDSLAPQIEKPPQK
jgi:hypothetical protein